MPRSWLALVAVITVLLPSVSHADANTWVVVGVGDASSSDAERQLRNTGKRVVRAVFDTDNSRHRRADAAEKLSGAIERVRSLYLEDKYSAGISELESTEELVLSVLLATEQGRALLVELNLWLGALHVAKESVDGARARFRLALLLDDTAALDAAFWPPAYLEAFDGARATKAGTGSLLVTSSPAARVFIDGAPAQSSGANRVATGTHYVLAERIGYMPVARRAQVSSAGLQTMRVELTPVDDSQIADGAAIATSWYRDEPRASARAIAAAVDADRVVVVTNDGVVLHDRDGVQIGSGKNVDALFSLSATPPTAPKKESSIYSKWWFWTAVGGVALAAGGGAYLYVDSRRGDPVFEF